MRNILTLTSIDLAEIDKIAQKRFENAKKNSKQFTYGNKMGTDMEGVADITRTWVQHVPSRQKVNNRVL